MQLFAAAWFTCYILNKEASSFHQIWLRDEQCPLLRIFPWKKYIVFLSNINVLYILRPVQILSSSASQETRHLSFNTFTNSEDLSDIRRKETVLKYFNSLHTWLVTCWWFSITTNLHVNASHLWLKGLIHHPVLPHNDHRYSQN